MSFEGGCFSLPGDERLSGIHSASFLLSYFCRRIPSPLAFLPSPWCLPSSQEVSPRDAPLLGFMSAVAGVLGIANVLDSADASCPADENAENLFYEKFLVPRLLASASSSPGGRSGTARATMIPLKELVEMHLSTTTGKGARGTLYSVVVVPYFKSCKWILRFAQCSIQ